MSNQDRFEVGVTHQVYIDREPAWIKFQMQSDRQFNETTEQATARISAEVNKAVMTVIADTVEAVAKTKEEVK
jgi:hypothetical protein